MAGPVAKTEAGDPAWPEDAVEVAGVIGAWGIKGWIKVAPYATDPQALFSSKRWFLKAPVAALGARPGTSRLPALLRIVQARVHGDAIVAQAQDVLDRTGAEALQGARVFVSRSSFPSAGDDEYYWVDLIGLSVVNRAGDVLGTVVGLIDTGPHSVLRVTPAQATPEVSAAEAERLIPFVGAYVDSVSLPERRIVVDWGLDY